VWAILATVLCCLPFGIVAIVQASRVDSRWMAGDWAGAERASRRARQWVIASAVASAVIAIVWIVAVAASGGR
jgi:predicted secreted protein